MHWGTFICILYVRQLRIQSWPEQVKVSALTLVSKHSSQHQMARLHKRVHDQRNNFYWQTAHRLVGEYALISLEDLNLKGMQKLYGRKISDLGFADFFAKLE